MTSQESCKKSALYDEHIKLVNPSRLAEFAGYLMPLWYSSISAEHAAVREVAGLFDCTHMGVLEFSGTQAENFLNELTTNDVAKLVVGKAQYSYILDESAHVIDDIIVYKISDSKFMVVVNASNAENVIELVGAALSEQSFNSSELLFRDLKSQDANSDARVDIALQGPASIQTLLDIIEDGEFAARVSDLKPFWFTSGYIDGIDTIISRTGYTGASVGYEIYINPQEAGWIWQLILDKGSKYGVVPCGLGARDSLRIEAGLPLYSHELAGEFDISPIEAGYGWAVKFDKPYFVGKEALEKKAASSNMAVERFEFSAARGVRPIRASDAILTEEGENIGSVLSCAKAGERQIALAFVKRNVIDEGQTVGLYYLARNKRQLEQGKKEKVEIGEKLESDILGQKLARYERF